MRICHSFSYVFVNLRATSLRIPSSGWARLEFCKANDLRFGGGTEAELHPEGPHWLGAETHAEVRAGCPVTRQPFYTSILVLIAALGDHPAPPDPHCMETPRTKSHEESGTFHRLPTPTTSWPHRATACAILQDLPCELLSFHPFSHTKTGQGF